MTYDGTNYEQIISKTDQYKQAIFTAALMEMSGIHANLCFHEIINTFFVYASVYIEDDYTTNWFFNSEEATLNKIDVVNTYEKYTDINYWHRKYHASCAYYIDHNEVVIQTCESKYYKDYNDGYNVDTSKVPDEARYEIIAKILPSIEFLQLNEKAKVDKATAIANKYADQYVASLEQRREMEEVKQ